MPEVLLSVMATGQSVEISVDAFPGEQFSSEVYAIDPRIESSGRSIELRARVPNPDGRLRPGLFARVEIIFERREKRHHDSRTGLGANSVTPNGICRKRWHRIIA